MNYKNTIGIISGYFNPIHFGHIEYIQESKKLCDFLIAIVNNDEQVKLKKSKPFMDELHRKKILENIKGVDLSVISIDKDKSVCDTIKKIYTDYKNETKKFLFFNSGDRKENNLDSSEYNLCKNLEIEYIVIDKPKIYSSSNLLKNI
jgi:D-beta-D-heptose 7-phosphate kinase/D-beta-D-heptose 1-phosphate adenosyltransferase